MSTIDNKLSEIYLVGAGPGDPELLTLKAKSILEKSPLVIYDALVNPEILNFCDKNAELIKVGKRQGAHSYSQEQIAKLLIQKSYEFSLITRLKGGDPCTFGRGAEEVLDLLPYPIRIRIIPGITTATACAAYANLPLTHRVWSSSVSFITGTEAEGKSVSHLKWANIIAGSDTVVIYMALYNLPWIINKFIEVGKDKETPIMMIQWCSLPKQKTLTGTIGTILGQLRNSSFGPPSIAVIGDIVEVASILSTYKARN
uniref:uroporphyrinogen-III C-methyltransferase n=1 Tax=Gronococcus sybilensis TaxID=3028029 RepID=A0A9Y1I2F8_9RHOD|nr:urophorphyrin III methylase [Gronococcus sybilensis]